MIWLLLAVVVAVSLTVGACALWLPDRAPALLGSAKEITSAPAGVQEYTGATQVTMIPTVSQTRELVGNASGTVTEDMSSQGLTSGKTAMKVNGVSVVALATATPMYRDLATGTKATTCSPSTTNSHASDCRPRRNPPHIHGTRLKE